jgi:hypothetical protein
MTTFTLRDYIDSKNLLKADCQEAFANLNKLAERIPSDENKRLTMMLRAISNYINYLEDRDKINEEDLDGRC